MSVVPGDVDRQPRGREAGEAGGRVETGGDDQERIGADIDRHVREVFPSAGGEIDEAIRR